jgi:biopolymer transport protein ExbD
MPIFVPGRRDRHNRPLRSGKRGVVAQLSLTAMVDMFTVLVVFLLQNYNTTGEVIDIDDQVKLPQAHAVKELRPAYVVVVSKESIMLDKQVVASFVQVKEQQDWRIEALFQRIQQKFKEGDEKRNALGNRIQQAVDQTKPPENRTAPEDDKRVTVQADKSIDFLTVKKVMATLTQAGASEINFAVIKEEGKN